MPDPVFEKLIDLLAAEKSAIISADYTCLDELNLEKEHIFESFMMSGPNARDMGQVHEMLMRNQTLLASAINGVKTSRSRIEELKAVSEALSVYDHLGKRARVSTKSRDLEKKA